MLKIHLLILFGYVFCSKAQQPIIHLASFNNRMIPPLLQALIKEQSNVVYSPFGLTTSLSVIFEGIDDKIAEELCKILGLGPPRNTRENLRTGMKILLEYMQTQQKKNTDGTIGSFNKARVHSPEPLIPQYQQLLSSYYKTELQSNLTNNASELIFEYLTDTKVMSHWKDFDKLAVYTYLSHQASVPFMTADGEVVNVPMIPQVGLFRAGYHPKLSSQIVEIPFGEIANLVLIMPDNKDGIEDLLQKMMEVDLSTLTKSLPSDEVEVALPQFALVNSDIDLGRILKNSGLGVIFSQANKSKRGSSRALGGKGPVRTLKQNIYITTSFTSINSVATTTSILAKKVKKPKKPRIRLIQEAINVEPITETKIEPENLEQTQPNKPENIEQSQPEIEGQNEPNKPEESEATTTQESEETETRVKRETSQTYTFNKPFLFLIYHSKSGIVLLAGAVKRPTQVPNTN